MYVALWPSSIWNGGNQDLAKCIAGDGAQEGTVQEALQEVKEVWITLTHLDAHRTQQLHHHFLFTAVQHFIVLQSYPTWWPPLMFYP